MNECETCGSKDMYETTWILKNHKKIPVLRCNVCGYSNVSQKIEIEHEKQQNNE